MIWTIDVAALIVNGCASVLAESAHPHTKEAHRETAWLVPSVEASTSGAIQTTDDCLLATDETSHLQKTMIDENKPALEGSVQRKGNKTPRMAQPEHKGYIRKGDFLIFLSFLKISNVSSTFFLHILCIQYGNTGGIWWEGTFQNRKICNRSFTKILVADFPIRTNYSRTCTEDRRQIGERKWQVRTMLGTIKLNGQNRHLFSSNTTQYERLDKSNSHLMSSQILVPERLFGLMLEREGTYTLLS